MLEQYRSFRAQFVRRGVPLFTMAVGAHYEPWTQEFAEMRLVPGDLLFQQERLWMLGARLAEADGISQFLFLDSDVVFSETDWIPRVQEAFGRADLIQPFDTALHLYDDARMERFTKVRRVEERPGLRGATGLGIGFDSRFVDAWGPYQYAIVGGADKILWESIQRVLPLSTAAERRDRARIVLQESGYPPNAAFEESVWRWIEGGRRTYESLRLGYADGVHIVAMPHGHKENRAYRARYQVLHSYDPQRDLEVVDGEGLAFAAGADQLKEDVAQYMRRRST